MYSLLLRDKVPSGLGTALGVGDALDEIAGAAVKQFTTALG